MSGFYFNQTFFMKQILLSITLFIFSAPVFSQNGKFVTNSTLEIEYGDNTACVDVDSLECIVWEFDLDREIVKMNGETLSPSLVRVIKPKSKIVVECHDVEWDIDLRSRMVKKYSNGYCQVTWYYFQSNQDFCNEEF